MRNCFVPFCDNMCKGVKRRMMFHAPRDSEAFELWKNALPKRREFKSTDKVCSRHFNTEDIITTFDSIINGELVQMERDRPKLRPNAVPCRNLDLEKPENFKEHKRKYNRKKTNSSSGTGNNEDEQTENLEDFSDSDKAKRKKTDKSEVDIIFQEELSKIDDSTTEGNEKKDAEVEQTSELNYEVLERNIEEKLILEDFNVLYDEAYDVVLPNLQWGIHRCIEKTCIAFTYFDSNTGTTTKSVVLKQNGMIIIKIMNRHITVEDARDDISSVRLTSVLSQVDEITVCGNADSNLKSCLFVSKPGSDFCDECKDMRN